jgi:hypothetical protein
MYQTVNENISVLGVYSSQVFIPKKFKWKDKIFPIKEITLLNNVRDGVIRKRLYSVLSGVNLYRIEFNRDSENWKILEVWCE